MKDHHSASYSKLLGEDYRNSLHTSDTVVLAEDFNLQAEQHQAPPPISSGRKFQTVLIATIGLAYLLGSFTFMIVMYSGGYQLRAPDPPYTPAAEVIEYLIVKSDSKQDDALQGFPSEAHDEAWLDLVTPALSRVSNEEMRLGKENPEHSVAVGDGKGGYMASLGVYHELHCLRRLKLYIHKEHYYPKLIQGSGEDTYELNHLNHCLEAIRLSLMCAGNTALYTFEWPDSNEKVRKPKTKTNSERTCVDWSLIDQWARNRSIGMNPKLERPIIKPTHAQEQHIKENHR